MCWQIILRFCISLTETFSNSITFSVINKYSKRSVIEIFKQLSNHVFRSPQFRNDISYEGRLFLENFWKINIDFKNREKNWEKVFCFCDNCIWIGCIRVSLLIREYLSSSVNVLTNTFKISHIFKRDFFKLNYL